MDRLPPLNALRAFEVSGRTLTFRAAADELGVSQGAVAQQVRGLEAHLGMALFERQPKGLAFTDVGRSYHAQVQSAFSLLREATHNLKPAADKVLVSVTPTFASKWLIPNLPSFTEEHPNIDLRILATERVSSFHGDGIDLAIRQDSPPFAASLNAQLLFEQEIVAVASPSLVTGLPQPQTPEAIASLPKIHDTHQLWPLFLAGLGVEDKSGRGLQLNQTTLAIDAAIAGQGIALASRFLINRDLELGNLVLITPHTIRGKGDFYLLSRLDIKNRPSILSVIDWLKLKAAGR